MIKRLILAVFLLLSVTAAQADEAALPPPGVVKLHGLIGHWTGDGNMTEPGHKSHTVAIEMDCVEAAGGWAIQCSDKMTGTGINYLEGDLMGYDSQSNNYHWYAVTNAGDVRDYLAQWKGDAAFLANYTTKAGSQTVSEDMTIEFVSASEIDVTSTVTVATRESEGLRVRLTKSDKAK